MNENRDKMLAGKKSCDFAGVKVGYKKTPATLKPHKGVDWELVLARLQADRSLRKQFVSTTTKVDKTALKKADAETLEEVGLDLVQVDSFFVKLKI